MQMHFYLLQCENKSGEYPTSSGLNAMEARAAKSQRRKEEKKTDNCSLNPDYDIRWYEVTERLPIKLGKSHGENVRKHVSSW